DMPEAISGRRFSYLGPEAVLFQGTIFDNIVYGLKHRPVGEAEYDAEGTLARKAELSLARRTGSSLDDINADWIDYSAANAAGPDDLEVQILRVLKIVHLDRDVYSFGLRGRIDAENSPELAEQFLEARTLMRELLHDQSMTDLIEAFDPEIYNRNASIGENLLFGTPVGDRFQERNLAGDPYIREVLRTSKLRRALLQMGVTIAETMIEIFAGLPPGHELFEQFSFISSDDLGEYEKIIARWHSSGHDSMGRDDRRMLLSLPFVYVEPRHRLGLLDDEVRDKIVVARKYFAENITATDHSFVEFYNPELYNSEASLQDNVLFGRVGHGQSGAQAKVEKLISDVFDKLGLRDEIYHVGLRYNVGSGGKQLSAVQRVQTALARVMLKRPDLLILNEATSVLNERLEKDILSRIREDRKDFGVISVLKSPEMAEEFDYIAYLEEGRLVEQGSPEELKTKKGAFAAMLAA
ncbi:ABC transporter ATP-binding protein/permease, partial [Alphaproteobacteria bacterium]|nr:ABC transporter ATP-binding protein/permease [Alphaproteobacteria bacterium]